MTKLTVSLSGLLLLAATSPFSLGGCDDKKDAPSAMPSAAPSMTASAALPMPEATVTPTPSAAPSSSVSMVTGDPKDLFVTEKDPTKEPEKTVKAATGGTVTLFLPDYAGTVWSVDTSDKSLGKAKEEVIPGFAPGVNGHQFKWTALKAGKQKAQFVNKKTADKTAKPSGTFTLTIDAS